jgi:hypothetical protein
MSMGARPAVMAALIALASAGSADGAIVPEGATAAVGAGASIAFAHTVTSTPDQFLAVAVGVRSSGTTVTAVTYGGVPLTPVVSESAGGYCRSELWGLVAPRAGTSDVAVTLSSGNAASIAAAVSYAGVDGRSPIASTAGTHSTRGAVSVALAGSSAELVTDAVCGGGNSAPSGMPAAGQTQRWNRTAGTLLFAGSDRPGAAAATMQWTLTVPAALGWSSVAAALRPVLVNVPDAAAADGSAPDGPPLDGPGGDATVTTRDGGVPVDRPAGPDGGPQADALSLDGATPEDADHPGTLRPADASAPVDGSPGVLHLRVGCGCRAAGASTMRGHHAWLILPILLVGLRRRRPRPRG